MPESTASPYGHAFFAYQKSGSQSSADEIVPAVYDIVRPSSVVDVGCGVGGWLAAFGRAGVDTLLGLDGDHVPRAELLVPEDRFMAVDLRRPFNAPRTFDLAMSLEVAEHLPEESADSFVESLTKLAPTILFSAAVPHQGGWHHVNEQWPQYWADLFAQRNFWPVDCLRDRFWTNPRVRWWYAQNTVLYIAANSPLWQTCASFDRPLRALVHPENYLRRVADTEEATRARTAKETLVRIASDVAGLPSRALHAFARAR